MRDPARIEEMVARLRKVWYANPDLRLTQLIVNLQDGPSSIYYTEDDAFMKRLEKFYGISN